MPHTEVNAQLTFVCLCWHMNFPLPFGSFCDTPVLFPVKLFAFLPDSGFATRQCYLVLNVDIFSTSIDYKPHRTRNSTIRLQFELFLCVCALRKC